jgi:methylornithine synthase
MEYLVIAVMRLAMPDRLIPASLDVDGIQGLAHRLAAGANVVTSIIPPQASLAGVSQSVMDIEEGNRGVSAVRRVLKSMNLAIAGDRAYADWMAQRRGDLSQPMRKVAAFH